MSNEPEDDYYGDLQDYYQIISDQAIDAIENMNDKELRERMIIILKQHKALYRDVAKIASTLGIEIAHCSIDKIIELIAEHKE